MRRGCLHSKLGMLVRMEGRIGVDLTFFIEKRISS